MECNVKAYNGQDSYLFLDFCDEDSLRVYPLIERLTMEGVRVWYRTDESIEETMTKFESCKACLFAVSSKSADQHFFLSRMIYAIGYSRPTFIVELEDFKKTVGLMMQTDTVPHFTENDSGLYATLLNSPALQLVKAANSQASATQIAAWNSRRDEFLKLYAAFVNSQPQQKETAKKHVDLIKIDSVVNEKPDSDPKSNSIPSNELNQGSVASEADKPEQKDKPGKEPASSSDVKQTIVDEPEKQDEDDVTVYQETDSTPAAFVRLLTGQVYAVSNAVTTVGRKPESGKHADIQIDNTLAISRFHAIITRMGGNFYLRSDKAKFGTFVEGEKLEDGVTAELKDGSTFRLTNEDFLFVIGKQASSLQKMSPQDVLQTFTEEEEEHTVYNPPVPVNPVLKPQNVPDSDSNGDKNKGSSSVSTAADEYEDEFEHTVVDELISEMTVHVSRKPQIVADEDDDRTVRQSVLPAAILRMKTGEFFRLQQVENVIGRRTDRRKADIMLDGNTELSREHAVIYQYQGKFMIRDCGSLLGTFIGETKVDQDHATELHDQTVFTMAGEPFLFLTGASMKAVQEQGSLGILKSEASGEEKILIGEALRLDRKHPWADGLLAKNTISRNHAVISFEDRHYMIRDIGSSNGTFVNGVQIEKESGVKELHSGDVINIYDLAYRFTEIVLK